MQIHIVHYGLEETSSRECIMGATMVQGSGDKDTVGLVTAERIKDIQR